MEDALHILKSGFQGKDIDVFTYGADGVSGGEGSNKDWGIGMFSS